MQAAGFSPSPAPFLDTFRGRSIDWPGRRGPDSPRRTRKPMSSHATLDLDLQRGISQHRLANGLRVVLHRDAALPLVAVNLWYHVGSKNERPGRTGFAHLFEHMLFQGSEHVGTNEHFRYVQQVGGVANGSTWYDRTNYYETVPAHHLDLGLWLESDRMGYFLPALTQEKLDTQRDVVKNERRQRVDNQPYGSAERDASTSSLYPADHPYHWPVIGYMDDIAAATLDDVRTFFRTYYTPNNAVLSVVGDFEPDRGPGAGRTTGSAASRAGPAGAAGVPAAAAARRRAPATVLTTTSASPASTSASAPRPTASGLVRGRPARRGARRRQVEPALPRPRLRAPDRPGRRRLGGTPRRRRHLHAGRHRPPRRRRRDAGGGAARPRRRRRRDAPRRRPRTGAQPHADRLLRRPPAARQPWPTCISQFATYFDDPAGALAEADRYLEITPRELIDYAAAWCGEMQRVVVSVVPRKAS